MLVELIQKLHASRYLTQCSQSYSSNWFQHLCALPRNRCRIQRPSVLRYTTQLSYTFHNSNCTFVMTLFRLFVWLFFNLPVREGALCAEPTSRFRFIAFGRMPMLTRRYLVQEPFKKYLHGGRLNSQTGFFLWHFFFSTHFPPRVFEDCGSEGGSAFGVGFARSLLSCRKLH